MNNYIDNLVNKLYLQSIDHFVNYKKHIKDYLIVIAFALFLRSMVIVIYTIPTGSMIPTLQIGDVLLSDRFYYGLKLPFTEENHGLRLPSIKEPETGDIVVFRAPREEYFYELTIFINDREKANPLLLELNQASSFKRPISWKDDKINYIFRSNSENLLTLHESVYQAFREKLHSPASGISIANVEKRIFYRSFKEKKSQHYLQSILNTPMAGLSILVTVFLDTPLGFFYKIAATELFADRDQYPDFMDALKNFSLYPNSYVDTTKDFVKRLIAKEGDTVEIRNSLMFINGQPVTKVRQPTSLSNQYVYYTETLTNHKGEKISFTTRYYNELINNNIDEPKIPFREDLWPYDPNNAASQQFFIKNFGPITVPKGNYFLMGDNRDESFDCRFFGTAPDWAIKGRPFFRLLPAGRFGGLK